MKLVLREDAVRAKLRALAANAVSDGAHTLLNAAKSACPVETGRLRESGYARAEGMQAAVGFDAPYAACVHERQNKFLENAANDSGVQNEILSVFVRGMMV